jgi:hypothetical protein
MSRSAEQILEAVLEREWNAQSGGSRPLATTAAVREAFELTASRSSAFEVAALLPSQAPTPQALLDRMRPVLPAEVDPWAERLLERLSPGEPEPPGELLAAAPAPTPAPAPPPALRMLLPARRPRRVSAPVAGVCGAALGMLLGAFAARRRWR